MKISYQLTIVSNQKIDIFQLEQIMQEITMKAELNALDLLPSTYLLGAGNIDV